MLSYRISRIYIHVFLAAESKSQITIDSSLKEFLSEPKNGIFSEFKAPFFRFSLTLFSRKLRELQHKTRYTFESRLVAGNT